MTEHIKQVLTGRADPVRLEEVAAGYFGRQVLITLLLALLEMMRLREVVLRQTEVFGTMTIGRGETFTGILSGNEARGGGEKVDKTRDCE